MIDQEHYERVLRERAERVSRRAGKKVEDDTAELMVVVALGEERLALQAHRLFRVARYRELSRFPGTPNWCVGLTHARGQLVTVVDLEAWLGRPTTSRGHAIAIVEGSEGMLGLLIDGVVGVRRLTLEALGRHGSPLPFSALTDDLVSLVDVDALFASPRMRVTAEAP